jgi:orotate phosphoribosyltransferase
LPRMVHAAVMERRRGRVVVVVDDVSTAVT